MKKCLFLCFLVISSISYGKEGSTQRLKERLELQQVFRPGNWCLVPWKGGWCTSDILSMDNEKIMVKVIDTSLPPSKWPMKVYDQIEISSHRHSMFITLDDLVNDLRAKQILRSDFIERGFRAIDRSWFCQYNPYFDSASDIGCGMCISSPHIHVLSLELVKKVFPHARKILDVGTGTGYMAAIFACLAPQAEVYGVDCFPELIEKAESRCKMVLPESISKRITFYKGQGEKGCLKEAPYDLIYVGFMCRKIPLPLVKQLKPGGILLIPIANCISTYDAHLWGGKMMMIEKDERGVLWGENLFNCSFIPTQKNNPKACLEDPGGPCGAHGEAL